MKDEGGEAAQPDRAGSATLRRIRRRRWRKLCFVLITVAGLIALGEVASRLFWSVREKESRFFSRDTVLFAYYPKLARASLRRLRRHDDRSFDILLLGGSVLTDAWTDVDAELERVLGKVDGRDYRIHNVARAGHTSRDSLHKYQLLGAHRFDLVIVYHGINEATVNCCPPEMFRADYSHMNWYAEVNSVVRNRPLSRYLTVIDSLHHLGIKIRERIDPKAYLPAKGVDPDYVHYGSDIRSKASFKDNLRQIIKLAHERGDPIALLTYATYVPPGYSRQAFDEKTLDYNYGKASVPIELWGAPDNVQAAVRAHNDALRELNGEERPDFFLDIEHLMPQRGDAFDDVCHFSDSGSATFVELLVDGLGLAKSDAGE